MRNALKLFGIAFLLLALSACAREPEPPAEPAPETVAEAVESPELEIAPPAEPAPEPKPLPEMTAGERVTVEGTLLAGGSVWIEDTAYVRLREVAEALNVELTWSEQVGTFPWDGGTVTVAAGSAIAQVAGQALALPATTLVVTGEPLVPLALLELLGLGRAADPETGQLYYTDGAADFPLPQGYHVPTLMYHAVSDDLWGFHELFVSPANMEAQLQYLQENGYTTIHFSDLEHIDQIEKPVLLTFDDGYLDNYTELFPLLQKYNAKATIFAITKSIGTHHLYFNWEQAREMADSGLVEIHSHTFSHPDLDELTYEEQKWELEQSKLDILRNLGRESYVLCYPTGRYNADTLALVGDYYNFALKMNGNDYYTDENVYEINRWYVSRYTDLWAFGDMVG